MHGPITTKEMSRKWAACLLWLIPAVVVAAKVSLYPNRWDVNEIYHDAVTSWWAHEDVYTGPKGFNYLPLFLPLYGLFDSMPFGMDEILWRWVAFAGLGIGLWRCCGLMAPANRWRAFTLVTVLSLPICLSALRNGQSSAHLAACLVLAAWCLHSERRGWATLWLCLALICKPLGIVAIGLAVMTFPHLWWRMAIGLVAVVSATYLFGPPAYVSQQYLEFTRNLMQCFDTSGRTFADLNGLLMVLGLKLSGIPSLVVRVAAGAGMAVGCWYLGRFEGDLRRTFLWLGLTGSYIMLFTPMNESNSYVMLAPAYGLWACWFLERGEKRTAQGIAFISLTSAVLSEIVRLFFGKITGNQFDKFWMPLMALVFLGILISQIKQAFFEQQSDRVRFRSKAALE